MFQSRTHRFATSLALLAALLLLAPEAVLAAAADTARATRQVTLAVTDFDSRLADSPDLGVLRDALIVELQNSGNARVMERSQMNTILKEQGFQRSGACDASECAVEIGKLLAVDRMVLGSVGKLGETWSMTLRMVDVRTGEVLTSVRDTRTGSIDVLLKESVPLLAAQLLGGQAASGQAARPTPGKGDYGEAFLLLSSGAYKDDIGFEKLKAASTGLTPGEAYSLDEKFSVSRGWAWGNLYPFLPIGSMVQGDWAGIGLIYLGWTPTIIAAANQSSSWEFLAVLAYAWTIARPILHANSVNDHLKEGLHLADWAEPTPQFAPDGHGGWTGSLAWSF
jgi:curli biogenesis system outer membrane secretion channel CsgG